MSESALVEKIKKSIEQAYPGCWMVKIHGGPFQTAGIPDLIGCINGRFVGIEVKLPGKESTLTKLQELCLKKLVKAGAIAFMSTAVDHSLKMVEDNLKK